MLFILAYVTIAFLVLFGNCYRKGCELKRGGGYFDFGRANEWDMILCLGTFFWPGFSLVWAFKGFNKFLKFLKSLGYKHGCGK